MTVHGIFWNNEKPDRLRWKMAREHGSGRRDLGQIMNGLVH